MRVCTYMYTKSAAHAAAVCAGTHRRTGVVEWVESSSLCRELLFPSRMYFSMPISVF